MHGQQTMKFLNDKAVADAIMAKSPAKEIDPKLDAAFKELMAEKAKAAASTDNFIKALDEGNLERIRYLFEHATDKEKRNAYMYNVLS